MTLHPIPLNSLIYEENFFSSFLSMYTISRRHKTTRAGHTILTGDLTQQPTNKTIQPVCQLIQSADQTILSADYTCTIQQADHIIDSAADYLQFNHRIKPSNHRTTLQYNKTNGTLMKPSNLKTISSNQQIAPSNVHQPSNQRTNLPISTTGQPNI
jgi:hypothetical protein